MWLEAALVSGRAALRYYLPDFAESHLRQMVDECVL